MMLQPDLICALPILPQIPVESAEAMPQELPDFAGILQEITEVETEELELEVGTEMIAPEWEFITIPVVARVFVPQPEQLMVPTDEVERDFTLEPKQPTAPAIELQRAADSPDVQVSTAPPTRTDAVQLVSVKATEPEMTEDIEQRSTLISTPPPIDQTPTFTLPYHPIAPIPIAAPKPILVPAQAVQHIAEQIAVSIANDDSGTTEIALNPEELGRVRLHMTVMDQTVQIVIAAERPETSDLMRRHLDVLQQEFRSLGFQSVDLGFADEGGRNSPKETPKPTHIAVEFPPEDTPPHLQIISTGIDIRL
ncbi:flagellar hook-length control protein FliK [Marivivens donghaensis]|jgi:flagellar hook-length control protein FliK|uniref:flagellar hook-length control protein FliK n=1 Tax=Marivivens donghaensis TaxID=1699413 RepID=UPI003F6A45F3